MNELTTQTIDPMLQMIERVALDPNADVSKLEKLIELSERVSDRQRQRCGAVALYAAGTGEGEGEAHLSTSAQRRRTSRPPSRSS